MNGMVWELVFGGMLLGLLFWELKRVRQAQQQDREKQAKADAQAEKPPVPPGPDGHVGTYHPRPDTSAATPGPND